MSLGCLLAQTSFPEEEWGEDRTVLQSSELGRANLTEGDSQPAAECVVRSCAVVVGVGAGGEPLRVRMNRVENRAAELSSFEPSWVQMPLRFVYHLKEWRQD